MKKSSFKPLLLSILFAFSMPVLADNYTCQSASALHEQKMNKYKLPEFPSLLADCGFGDLIASFGFDLNFGIDDIKGFCGYTGSDIASWYGADISNGVGVKGGINLDALNNGAEVFGDVNLFEGNNH